MNCDTSRQLLLEFDWDEAGRRRVEAALAHLEECASCRSAMSDYDLVRASLRSRDVEAKPPGGWAAFENRLAKAAAPPRPRSRLMPAALAASLLIAFTGWAMYLQVGGVSSKPTSGTQRGGGLAVLSAEEVGEQVQVFDQVASLFDHRLGWVLIGGQASDMGLDADRTNGSGQLLVLRLAASRGRDLCSKADLVIVPGQSASLTVPSAKGPTLRYQIATSKSDPTRLQVWVEAEQPEGAGAVQASLATDLNLEAGRVTSLGQMVTPGGRYDVNVTLAKANPVRRQA